MIVRDWGARAASPQSAAACRRHFFSAGCRKVQAGSLRSPEKITRSLRTMFVLCALGLASDQICAAAPLQPATIVVFNKDIPESVELAKFYAQKRGIARDHLVGLACSKEEEISREEYDATIAEPLRKIFRDRKWWTLREAADASLSVRANSIRFVALIKGMPLKIRPATNYLGDQPGAGPLGNRNDASVDSELATLASFSHQISGALANAYFQSYLPITELDAPLMLVCRLGCAHGGDGATHDHGCNRDGKKRTMGTGLCGRRAQSSGWIGDGRSMARGGGRPASSRWYPGRV